MDGTSGEYRHSNLPSNIPPRNAIRSGRFGTFVAGHLEGLLIVFIGVAMFWAGWLGSQARGLSCLGAALLNTLDASVTTHYYS